MNSEEFVRQMTDEEKQEILERVKPYFNYLDRAANKKIALMALYRETDDLFTEIRKDIRDQIKCGKGCAHCCHIRAVSTELEAEVAVNYAKGHGLEIDTDRLEQQKDLPVHEYALSPHKRCVFLQADNTCGIYPVRPMACRTYFVINDAKFCDTDAYPGGEQAVVNNLPMAYPGIALLQLYDLDSFPKQLLKVINQK